MDLKERVNVVQAKMNGAVAALTYGFFAHMNAAGGTVVDIGTDLKAVDSENINNSACSSEMLRGLVHAFTDIYKGKLTLNETVCDPKYIPSNCIMKDKYGYMQRGAAAELSIDYPLTDSKKHDWTEGTISSTSRRWISICYGIGKFVAVANESNILAYSSDGINWTEGTISSTSREWYSVCYGNGKFVTVAYESNYFAYSTDGITWTESTISETSRNWSSVCYGNGKFVVISGGDYNSNYFAYSTDGITWTEGTISSTRRQWCSVCYGNDKFVAVTFGSSYFAYSTDGITWTEGTISDTSRGWYSVCYGNGKFVVISTYNNYFAYSTDGINWTEGTISETERDWQSVCYGNDKFVAIANSTNYFAYSTDGINWTEGTISSTSRNWNSVCYGNGKFVTVAGYNSNYFAYSKPNYDFNICNYITTVPYDYDVIGSNDYSITPNISDIDGTFLTKFSDYPYKFIGVILYNDKNISTELNNIINKNNEFGYLAIFDHQINSTFSDQNYKYMVASDSINNKTYFVITNDLLHYTAYDITNSPQNYITFKNGIIFIYLPEKDSVAMITRHPHTTDIITIDGNDPENMTDITKPYYRLIEIPFLKKYYKYTGKHVKNVKICIRPYINNYSLYTDCVLLINVFDRVYKIGIPNYIDYNINCGNNKRLQNFYTTTPQTFDQIGDRNYISSLLNITDLNTEYINYSIYNNYNSYIYNKNHLKITVDEMNYGYDHNADDTVAQMYNIVNNYTNTGYAAYSDNPGCDYIYFPEPKYSNEGGGMGPT